MLYNHFYLTLIKVLHMIYFYFYFYVIYLLLCQCYTDHLIHTLPYFIQEFFLVPSVAILLLPLGFNKNLVLFCRSEIAVWQCGMLWNDLCLMFTLMFAESIAQRCSQ